MVLIAALLVVAATVGGIARVVSTRRRTPRDRMQWDHAEPDRTAAELRQAHRAADETRIDIERVRGRQWPH